jgi:hypothetical protein
MNRSPQASSARSDDHDGNERCRGRCGWPGCGADPINVAQQARERQRDIIYLYWATSVEVLFLERNPNQGVRVGG